MMFADEGEWEQMEKMEKEDMRLVGLREEFAEDTVRWRWMIRYGNN